VSAALLDRRHTYTQPVCFLPLNATSSTTLLSSAMTKDCISTITVKNTTSEKMERGGNASKVDGEYENYPPIEIKASGEATIKMKANSGLAGSDGNVVYYLPYKASQSPPFVYQAKIYIAWNCPYIGYNSVTCTSNVPSVKVVKGSYTEDGDLTVTITVSK